QLKDKNGIYDRYIEIITLDGKENIVHSQVLKEGFIASINSRQITFIKETTIANPFKDEIFDFLNMGNNLKKYERILQEIIDDSSATFENPKRFDSLLEKNYYKLVA